MCSLQFAGANMDDLSEGIQPFALMLQDHSNEENENVSVSARGSAEEYDRLMLGSVNTDLSDIRALRATSKISLSTAYHRSKVLFQAMSLLLKGMSGSTHEIYLNYQKFVRTYTNHETHYLTRLSKLGLVHGPHLNITYHQNASWELCHL
jgi:hypothetical protein